MASSFGGAGARGTSPAVAAARQRERLRALQGDREQQQALLDQLSARRSGHPDRPQFEVFEVPGGQALPMPAELLADAAQVQAGPARALIRTAGFGVEVPECLRGRVALLAKDGAARDEVTALHDSLRDAGVDVSFAYVTPNKIVIKSDVTPEKALATPPSLPAAEPGDKRRGAVKVALLDTGIALCDRDDGWLAGLETDETRDPLDVFPETNGYLDWAAGHGTFIAGLVQRIDPGLDLLIRRVMDTDGFDSEVAVACALVTVVDEALEAGGRLLVNLSLGTETLDDRPPLALKAALAIVREIEAERGGEVMLVAAAGNEGSDRRCWPAAFAADDDRVVAVAALGDAGAPATWSSRGPWVTCSVDGEAVLSTYVVGREDPAIDRDGDTFDGNAWAYWTGTSFAAPQVAARIGRQARMSGSTLAEALREVLAAGRRDPDDRYGVLLPPSF